MGKIESPLTRLGFDPYTQANRLNQLTPEERFRELAGSLEGRDTEGLKDTLLSPLYNYWLDDKGEIFTEPSLKDVFDLQTQCDVEERSGLIINGLRSALHTAKNNPQNLVGLYSPIGPTSFDSRVVRDPYNYGQLYLFYFDGKKINAVAVKTSEGGEKWVEGLMGNSYNQIEEANSEIERISAFIQTPFILGPINDFLNQNIRTNSLIYNGRDKKFYLAAVFYGLSNRFAGREIQDKSLYYFQAEKVAYQPVITPEQLLDAYLSFDRQYLAISGQDSMKLMGSCGGRTISIGEINDILGLNKTPIDNVIQKLGLTPNLFSTAWRVDNQTEKKWDYHDGECCICHQKAKVGPCDICKKCEIKFD